MKFCDKLIKKRKENNLSQEQFADKLGVSRQAVSKWEAGGTYPDMEKILRMCKILNCNLEDLMDDGVIGEKTLTQKNKASLDVYFKSFLNYITKVYNMFMSMKFKDVVKCLLEIIFIGIAIAILGQLVVFIVDDLLFDLLLYINKIGSYLYNVFYSIFQILIVIIDVIIFLHLFKIRYLDYYVTVEDQNVSQKTIENSIDQSKFSKEDKKQKEKIIIRDPKHSTFTFFDFLAKIVVFVIKFFVVCMEFLAVMAFISFVCFFIFSLCHISYGSIFLYIAIAFLGLIFIGYCFIQLFYDFIFNLNPKLKILFTLFIVGLFILGIGAGLSLFNLMSYEYVEETGLEYSIKEEKINIDENTIIEYDSNKLNFVIDNSLKQAKIEIKQFQNIDGVFFNDTIQSDEGNLKCYYIDYFYRNGYAMYKQFLDDIKNKRIREYNFKPTITIYISQKDYNQFMINMEKRGNIYVE